MKRFTGYTKRPDGTWAKRVQFGKDVEIIVRDRCGKLLRVER